MQKTSGYENRWRKNGRAEIVAPKKRVPDLRGMTRTIMSTNDQNNYLLHSLQVTSITIAAAALISLAALRLSTISYNTVDYSKYVPKLV